MPGLGGGGLRRRAIADHDLAGVKFCLAERVAQLGCTGPQLRTSASELSQALVKAELQPGDIVIREGAPPQPAPAKAGHFLDRAL